jgi:hypothetical protein
MPLAFLTLFTGLTLSAVAIYYSVIGLTAVFAAAFWPVIIMGVTLEVAKLVTAWWLKSNWSRAPKLLRSYMLIAVIVLMLITSMGIFGFLSKAHLDQNIVSGDVQSKISLVDEKIKIERDNIANAQEVIKQMDAAVNGVIATGDQEVKLRDGSTQIRSAAERSLQIRRSQAKDREVLTKEIETAQSKIIKLQEEIAPVRAEMRKVEAEVGPIKYIAKLIYGDQTDQNMLEKSVTWVIMIIVFVFDPLAVLLLLASQMSFQWVRENKEPAFSLLATPRNDDEPPAEPEPVDTGYVKGPWPFTVQEKTEQDLIDEANAKLAEIPVEPDIDSAIDSAESVKQQEEKSALDQWNEMIEEAEREVQEESSKAAKQKWKADHPNDTIKKYEKLHEQGILAELPWEHHEEQVTAESVAQSYQEKLNLSEDRIKPDLTEVIEPDSKKKTTYIIKEQDQQIRKEKDL